MVRQALVALLELEPDIEVVAQAADGDEALAMARKHQPDVAVLDIEMPGPSGIEVAGQLTKSGFGGKVSSSRPSTGPAICAPPWPPEPADSCSRTLRRPTSPLPSGRSPQASAWWIRRLPPLRWPRATARSLTGRAEVLAAAASHDAIADIAARLHLSPGTVRNHLSAAIQKLGARNRAEAVEMAQQKGWL